MTKITYYEDHDEISLEIKGHAGFAKKGEDLVCAAVSTLGQTLVIYLNIDNDKFDYSIRDGYLWCYAKGSNAKTALHVIMAGLHTLAENYPDHVSINRGCAIQRTP